MTAQSLSIPVFIFAVIATYDLLRSQVQNHWTILGLGIALGICLIYVLLGMDVLMNRKRDNPEAIPIPKPVQEAFGIIQERIRETNVGPYWWSIRTGSPEESRILATLRFVEVYPGLVSRPQQLERQIGLTVRLAELPEEEQKPESEVLAKMGVNSPTLLTSMELSWTVDSPYNRTKCNQIIEDVTYDLKSAVGLTQLPKAKEPHPLEPPSWAIMVLIIALFMTGISYAESEGYRKQMEEQTRVEELRKALDGRAGD